MLEYQVTARRIDAHGSRARCKDAEVVLDTDVSGRTDAFNPAELLLAALAACMIKGIERVTPMLKFELRGVEVRLRGKRQDSPPRMHSIDYELIVDTDEEDRRLELLHTTSKAPSAEVGMPGAWTDRGSTSWRRCRRITGTAPRCLAK
jgi:uncharacterized OsmC-like protein